MTTRRAELSFVNGVTSTGSSNAAGYARNGEASMANSGSCASAAALAPTFGLFLTGPLLSGLANQFSSDARHSHAKRYALAA